MPTTFRKPRARSPAELAGASFLALAQIALLAQIGCSGPLDAKAFQRRVEQVYVEANPGFGVMRRDDTKSTFARGDQTYALDVAALYADYQASKKSSGDYLDGLLEKLTAEARARRRTLSQARFDMIPILKSGSWIRVQDLGAIGPPSKQEELRPWRKELNPDLYVLLGVPEELLGYRYASMKDVRTSTTPEVVLLARAVGNLARKPELAKADGVEVRGADKRLLIFELDEAEGIGALILDSGFRQKMLNRFQKDELGAALPTRDRLIIFDPSDFVAIKPVRAKTHQLFDTQNNPGFRGLLRFDKDLVLLLESGAPEADAAKAKRAAAQKAQE